MLNTTLQASLLDKMGLKGSRIASYARDKITRFVHGCLHLTGGATQRQCECALRRDIPTKTFHSQQATESWTAVRHMGHVLTFAAHALQSTRCLQGSSSMLRSAVKHTMQVILSVSVFALTKRASSRARCISRTVTKRDMNESSRARSCSSERDCRAATSAVATA